MLRRDVLTLTAATAASLALPTLAQADAPLDVVATTAMVADAARHVGGDAVTVRALMGPGVDPHSYRQTRSDLVALTQADVVLWHGLYLEAQLEELMARLSARQPVFAVGEAVPQDKLRGHEDYAGRFDPHVWMDPNLWTYVVRAVQDALTQARPDAAAIFAQNAEAHLQDIAALEVYTAQVLNSVPQEARVLVTAHDAFGYFGQAHGFEVLGIQGISTESEAGLQRIGTLVDLLVDRDVRAVFVETSVSDRNIRALIEGAAARGHGVVIGGALYSDAMGPDGTYEGTYLGMIDHNATVIAGALGGEVPTKGRLGQLMVGG
ncbi:MAG: zinc ABC transporter substrate-binding protein [Pseudomonadota bacterium]